MKNVSASVGFDQFGDELKCLLSQINSLNFTHSIYPVLVKIREFFDVDIVALSIRKEFFCTDLAYINKIRELEKEQPSPYPWLLQKLETNEMVVVESLEIIPEDQPDRQSFEKLGIGSFISMSIHQADRNLLNLFNFSPAKWSCKVTSQVWACKELLTPVIEKYIKNRPLIQPYQFIPAFDRKTDYLISWYDNKNQLMYISDSCFELLGYEPIQLINDQAFLKTLFTREDLKVYRGLLKKVTQGKRRFAKFRHYLLPLSGSKKLFESKINVAYDSFGNRVGVVITSYLVPENKIAAEPVTYNDVDHMDLSDSPKEYLLRLNRSGTILSTNNWFSDLIGLPVEKIVGKSWMDFQVFKESKTKLEELLKQTTLQNPSGKVSIVLNSKCENPRWFIFNSFGIFDAESELTEIQLIGYDITERIETKEKLQISEQKYKAVVDAQTDQIIRIKVDGTFLFVNEHYARFRGYTPDQLMGKNWFELPNLKMEDKELIRKLHTYFTTENPVIEFDVQRTRFDGEKRWVTCIATGIFNNKNELTAIQAVVMDVTEKKMIEQQLQLSEQKYKAVVETQTELIFRIRIDGTLLFVNENYARFMGTEAGELMGRSIFEIGERSGVDKSAVQKVMSELSQDKHIQTCVVQRRRCDGVLRWMRINQIGIFDENGALAEIQIVATDITDIKNAEDNLRISEEKYRAIIDAQLDYIVRFYPGSVISYVNGPLAYTHPAHDPSVFIGKKWLDFVDPSLAETVLHNKRNLNPANPCFRLHAKHDLPSTGQKIWVDWVITGIFDDKNKIIEYQAVGRDVTPIVQLTAQLNESENRYKFLLDSMPDYVTVSKPDGTLLLVNEGYARFENQSIEELIGQNYFQFLDEEEINKLEALIAGLSMENPVESTVLKWMDFEKSENWFNWSVKGIFSSEGELTEVLSIGHDITAQKLAEIKLQIALEEVNILKDVLEKENIVLKEKIKTGYNVFGITTHEPEMISLLEKVKQVAVTNSPVLITGETGTGKELIAHAIHEMSKRNRRTMITINCAAIPASLIESELFGREKGAFTGALTKQIGSFELADKSTLFLDEIGDLPLETQAKLLRVLQFGEFQRLGNPVVQKTDVRIVAATNQNLIKAMENGTFRSDLFYRLNVFPLQMIPLRERKKDIPLLAWQFVEQFSKSMGKRIETISKSGMEKLVNYHWPGNIRELRNTIEYSMIIAATSILRICMHNEESEPGNGVETLKFAEKQHITKALDQAGWRIRGKNGAAEILGMKESTLRYRIKKLGIKKNQ